MQQSLQNSKTDRQFRRAQWRILSVTCFCYLFFYLGRHTFGFAMPGIEKELGIEKDVLAWASAFLLWSYALGQAINGNLGDKVGGRKMMSLGALLSCGLNWATSFGTSFWSLMTPWSANGFAQSMAWAPGSRVLSNWFSAKERGKVYGIYVFAAGMSSVLAFVTSLIILDTLKMNWRWIFRIPVLFLAVAGVIYYLVCRNRPEDLGYKLDSHDDLKDETLEQNDQAMKGKADAYFTDSESTGDRYLRVLSNRRFIIACIGIGFQSMARYGLIFWVPVHFLGELHKKNPETKWVSIALPVGMALGAYCSGWLSDRVFGSRRWFLISIFLTLAAIVTSAMYFVQKDQMLLGIVLLFLSGFFVYGPQSAYWALCPDLLGRKYTGIGTGVMNSFAYAIAGLGEVLIGNLIKNNQILLEETGQMVDNTGLIFPIVSVACIIGAVLAPLIRR